MPYRITAAMTFPDDRDVWGGSYWLLYWQSGSALFVADESESHPRHRAVRTPSLASFHPPGSARPSLPPIGKEAPVQVQYVHAENFADVGNHRFSDERIRAAYLEQLRGHLVKQAAARLGAGERKRISVTEPGLARGIGGWAPPPRHA